MDEYGMNEVGAGVAAGMAVAMIGIIIVSLLVYLFIGFCLGKLFEKAGKPLWAGFVPVYNVMVILELVGRPMWWIALFLLGLIPIVGTIIVVVMMAIIWIDFAKSYGKDVVWGLLITFFSVIMLPIMAFSDDVKYIGPSAGGTSTTSTTNA